MVRIRNRRTANVTKWRGGLDARAEGGSRSKVVGGQNGEMERAKKQKSEKESEIEMGADRGGQGQGV